MARFVKGQSGNPNGRPKGSLNKKTLLLRGILESQSEQLARKCMEMALNGSEPAMKLCLERLVPVVKEVPISIDLGNLKDSPENIIERILCNVSKGRITVTEGRKLIGMIAAKIEISKYSELEAKLDEMLDEVE